MEAFSIGSDGPTTKSSSASSPARITPERSIFHGQNDQEKRPMKLVELQAGYDPVAEDYAREFCDEMSKKPFDRKMLDWLMEKVNGLGTSSEDSGGQEPLAGAVARKGRYVDR